MEPLFLTVNTCVGAAAVPFTFWLPAFTVLESTSKAVMSAVAAISNAYPSPAVPDAVLLDKSALTNNVFEVPAGIFQFKLEKVIVPVPAEPSRLLVTLPESAIKAPPDSYSSTLDTALATVTPVSTPLESLLAAVPSSNDEPAGFSAV